MEQMRRAVTNAVLKPPRELTVKWSRQHQCVRQNRRETGSVPAKSWASSRAEIYHSSHLLDFLGLSLRCGNAAVERAGG
jgi:hypothetical protein